MPRRTTGKKRKSERVAGYDSPFEKELHEGILSNYSFHTEKIEYTIDHRYEPDFIREIDGKKIYVEVKGRFFTSDEAAKYVWVKKVLKEDEELVFLFFNLKTIMPGAKVRKKCGTKRTVSEWAAKNGFRYFDMNSFPEELR